MFRFCTRGESLDVDQLLFNCYYYYCLLLSLAFKHTWKKQPQWIASEQRPLVVLLFWSQQLEWRMLLLLSWRRSLFFHIKPWGRDPSAPSLNYKLYFRTWAVWVRQLRRTAFKRRLDMSHAAVGAPRDCAGRWGLLRWVTTCLCGISLLYVTERHYNEQSGVSRSPESVWRLLLLLTLHGCLLTLAPRCTVTLSDVSYTTRWRWAPHFNGLQNQTNIGFRGRDADWVDQRGERFWKVPWPLAAERSESVAARLSVSGASRCPHSELDWPLDPWS